jgi:molybdenum cofactor cytidylyltransferase
MNVSPALNDADSADGPRLGIVVLAAGMSTRFDSGGSPKQLFELEGDSLVRRACRAALDSRAHRCVVVLGHARERVAAELEREPALDIETVLNPDYASGQASSVRQGLAGLVASETQPLAGVLFLPCDQPRVDAALLDRLLTRFSEEVAELEEPPILVPRAAGRPSSPVLFPADLFDELASLDGDQGGRQLLSRHSERVVMVDIEDPELLSDIDTLADAAQSGPSAPEV